MANEGRLKISRPGEVVVHRSISQQVVANIEIAEGGIS